MVSKASGVGRSTPSAFTKRVITVYITKFALTQGIIRAVATQLSESMIMVEWDGIRNYFHHKDWYISQSKAIQRANEMRYKRLASLKKQIDKLAKKGDITSLDIKDKTPQTDCKLS